MCVIAIYRAKREKEENLQQMAIDNPDGTGVVFYKDGMPHYKKGLDIKEVLKLNEDLPFPYAFHFRLVTVGENKLLTHPYEVTPESALKMEGSAESLLMHNGHWSDWDEALLTHALNSGKDIPKGDWSDSRAMAYLGGIIGTNMLKMLSSQKIAIFNKNKSITVLGSGWENEKDALYSNKNWEWKTKNWGKITKGYNAGEEHYYQGGLGVGYDSCGALRSGYEWDYETKTLKKIKGEKK